MQSESQQAEEATLVDALDREIKARVRGTQSELERSLGKTRGWWPERVRARRIGLQELLDALDHLGLDPVAFLRQHVGRKDGLELNRPQGAMPALVERALERSRSNQEGAGIGKQYVDALDERRYEDPEGVVRSAEWNIDRVELHLLPRFLGIAGSAFRLHLRIDDAEHCLYAAVETCGRHSDEVCLGNLLRRYSYILTERADYAGALRLTEQGTTLLLRAKDLHGTAKGLVEQGLWLFRIGRHREAVGAFESGLGLLPAAEARYRTTAYQTMGLSLQCLGDLEGALGCLSSAEIESRSLKSWAGSKIRFLRAKIHASQGKLAEAGSELEEVLESLRSVHIGDAVLVACELVRVRLRQDQQIQALATVRSMLPFLEVVSTDRVVSGAIADLARQDAGGLSLALLESVIARLESEQSDLRYWASLRLVK